MAVYASLFAFAFILSLCLTPLVRTLARRAGVLDVPDGKRKRHPWPVPKFGGLAVFLAFYLCLWLVASRTDHESARRLLELPRIMLAPSLLILALGLVDDWRPLGPWTKIGVQIVAGLLVYCQLGIRVDTLTLPVLGSLGALSLPATLFWIVLITNAFNVVDGLDGLATGVAAIALVCMFLVALQMKRPDIALAAAPLAGAVLGFLEAQPAIPRRSSWATRAACFLDSSSPCCRLSGPRRAPPSSP